MANAFGLTCFFRMVKTAAQAGCADRLYDAQAFAQSLHHLLCSNHPRTVRIDAQPAHFCLITRQVFATRLHWHSPLVRTTQINFFVEYRATIFFWLFCLSSNPKQSCHARQHPETTALETGRP
jgi:hypothetical protein